jgi:hypothetical protein
MKEFPRDSLKKIVEALPAKAKKDLADDIDKILEVSKPKIDQRGLWWRDPENKKRVKLAMRKPVKYKISWRATDQQEETEDLNRILKLIKIKKSTFVQYMCLSGGVRSFQLPDGSDVITIERHFL